MNETLKKEDEKELEISEIKVSRQETTWSEQSTGEGEGGTLEELAMEEKKDKKIKNLTALVILLAGLFTGSLFIDFVQLFLASGYSERALKKADIFPSGDRTWVAFADPIVSVQVITLPDEKLSECPECDPEEVLAWMKKFLPTLVVKKVIVGTPGGDKLVSEFNLKSVPAFIFEKSVKETDFFGQAGVETIFEEKNEKMVLNKTLMGIPNGQFLSFPTFSEKDSIWGNKDGVKVVVFSDFQCPYSKSLFLSLEKIMKEGYQEKAGVVFKNLPAKDIHPLAEQAAKVAICAQEQGKFWEIARAFFVNQERWMNSEKPEILETYYRTAGVDQQSMRDCLASERPNEKLAADAKEAEEFSLAGTPSGFVGEKIFGGALEETELKMSIDEQL